MRRAYQMHITGALADLDLDWRKKAAYGAGVGMSGRKTYFGQLFSEGWLNLEKSDGKTTCYVKNCVVLTTPREEIACAQL